MSAESTIEEPPVAEKITIEEQVPLVVQRLAPLMFWLGFVHLLAFAGLIHRATKSSVTQAELNFISFFLIGVWPVFFVEAMFSLWMKRPGQRLLPSFTRCLAVSLFPPARMGFVHPATGNIWLPWLGWQTQGKELLKRLDRFFGLPLLLFALLILPILVIEYVWAGTVEESPLFETILNVCMAIIWVAFATEFIIKLESSGQPMKYAKTRWIDAAIVLLPTLEFILTWWASASPIARLLRTTRAIAPDQLARMGRLYRLRGLLMKGWHAILALELFARLVGDNPRKRMMRLEEQIAYTEEELVELRYRLKLLQHHVEKYEAEKEKKKAARAHRKAMRKQRQMKQG
ncbi:MAG: hypothetical protein R3B84_15040 [Zavarzinella sp.]